jgi:hydroxymethylbilane synthase
MAASVFRIGARGSALSLAQAGALRARLADALALEPEALTLTPFTTSGDKQQEGALIEAGGKGLFTKELDEALLDGRIDMGVHSLKDVPALIPNGIVLAAVPAREDARDAFISFKAHALEDLPQGARLGTASLRRSAQALAARPDLHIVTLRGNVETRLRKLEEGAADATFLAFAGLKRLGLSARATHLLDPAKWIPAPCQGALAITTRADDARALAAAGEVEDSNARIEIEAERAFLAALDGSCRTPIGALARVAGEKLTFIGEILTPDGARRWRREASIVLGGGAVAQARALGRELGESIRTESGEDVIWVE